jgi:3-isopropylmalate/(R)-2-methylmalate dehydratase large subunit
MGVAAPRPTLATLAHRRDPSGMGEALTLFDKIWNTHVVLTRDDGMALLWIDRHLVRCAART